MKYRKQLIEWLFNWSKKVYTAVFKKDCAWHITKDQLLTYPSRSIGKEMGLFLDKNNFTLIPKVERHDAYHTITGIGTNVEDEIALQYLCFGNGKQSLYLAGALLLGITLLPEYYKYYFRAYKIGKKAHAFHHFDYSKLLHTSIDDFRYAIFSNTLYQKLTTIKHPSYVSL